MDYVFFGQVSRICDESHGDKVVYTSVGRKFFMSGDQFKHSGIKERQHRFFGVTKKVSNLPLIADKYFYDCSTEMTVSDVKELMLQFKNMTNATKTVMNTYTRLTTAEREQVMGYVGTVLTGIGSVSTGINAVTALVAWDPFVFLGSAAASAGLGVLTYLQYERLSINEQRAADALQDFEKALTVYRTALNKYCPYNRSNIETLDPYMEAIVTDIKRALRKMNFSFGDLFRDFSFC